MTQFAIFVAYDESIWSQASPAQRQSYFAAHHAFEAAVVEQGTLVAGAALQAAATATTVRHAGGTPDGAVTATDGPFAETSEHIGGLYLVDLPDQATASRLAELLPAPFSIEVRSTVQVEGYESRLRAPSSSVDAAPAGVLG